jgi:hypothetical protein
MATDGATIDRGSYGKIHNWVFRELALAFDPQEVRVRTQGGRQLQYITARTAMNRLDDVVGAENWWDEYVPGENSVLCKLSIRLPDGEVLTKCDAGGYAGMADSGDDDKSGYSDAFKRAAAKFGIARYLYRDGVPRYHEPEPGGNVDFENSGADTTDPAPAPRPPRDLGTPNPPHNAGRAVPADRPPQRAPEAPRNDRRDDRSNHTAHEPAAPPPKRQGENSTPRTGRALFAWTKEQEQRHEVDLLKYLNRWGKLQEYPGRMVDWDGEQVALAFAEASRKIEAILAGEGERVYQN